MPFDNPVEVPVEITPLSILDDMIELLATPDRWRKRTFLERDEHQHVTGMCILGALYVADHGEHDPPSKWVPSMEGAKVRLRLMEYVGGARGGRGLGEAMLCGSIIHFNDRSETTHADVLNLLIGTRRSFEPSRMKRFCTGIYRAFVK